MQEHDRNWEQYITVSDFVHDLDWHEVEERLEARNVDTFGLTIQEMDETLIDILLNE